MSYNDQNIYEPCTSKEPICGGCQFTFPKFSMLAEHVSINNNDDIHINALYECNICGQNNMNYDYAVIHYSDGHLIELLEEEVISESSTIIIDKQKNKKDNLNKQCIFCGKLFRRPADLERHIRVHTGERPFKCDKCDESFKVKSHLTAHMSTHELINVKKYICTVCKKNYLSNSALKIHLRIHTNYNPFKCEHSNCVQTFRTKKLMKSHYKREHVDKIISNNQLFDLLTKQPRTIISNKTIIPRAIIPNVITPILPAIKSTPLILSNNSAFTPIRKNKNNTATANNSNVIIQQQSNSNNIHNHHIHQQELQQRQSIIIPTDKPPINTGQVIVRIQLRSVSVGPEHSNLRSQTEIMLYVDSLRTHAVKSSILSTTFRLGGCPMSIHMLVNPKETLEKLRESPETGFLMALTPAIGDPNNTQVDGPLYFVITPEEATWGVLPSLFIECLVMQPEATLENRQQFAQSCLPLLNDYYNNNNYPRF